MAEALKQSLLVLFGFCIKSTGNSREQHNVAQKAAFHLPWTSKALQLQACLERKERSLGRSCEWRQLHIDNLECILQLNKKAFAYSIYCHFTHLNKTFYSNTKAFQLVETQNGRLYMTAGSQCSPAIFLFHTEFPASFSNSIEQLVIKNALLLPSPSYSNIEFKFSLR